MAMVMMLMVLVAMVLTMGTMTVAVTTTKAMMSTCLYLSNIYPTHERYICPMYERAATDLVAPHCL